MVNEIMERIPVQMELDTGALPLLPLMMYMYQENVLTCTVPLQTTDNICQRTSGKRIYPKGEILVSIRKEPRIVKLLLVVVEGAGLHYMDVHVIGWHIS